MWPWGSQHCIGLLKTGSWDGSKLYLLSNIRHMFTAKASFINQILQLPFSLHRRFWGRLSLFPNDLMERFRSQHWVHMENTSIDYDLHLRPEEVFSGQGKTVCEWITHLIVRLYYWTETTFPYVKRFKWNIWSLWMTLKWLLSCLIYWLIILQPWPALCLFLLVKTGLFMSEAAHSAGTHVCSCLLHLNSDTHCSMFHSTRNAVNVLMGIVSP